MPDIYLITNKTQMNNEVALAIRDSLLYYANIKIIVKTISWEEYRSVLMDPESKNWHMIRLGFAADYPDPNNWFNDLFNPSSHYNFVGWNNTEYTNIIQSASRELDPTKRRKMFARAEEIICNEKCVALPLFYEKGIFLLNPRIKNWYYMAIGGQHIRNWSLGERN